MSERERATTQRRSTPTRRRGWEGASQDASTSRWSPITSQVDRRRCSTRRMSARAARVLDVRAPVPATQRDTAVEHAARRRRASTSRPTMVEIARPRGNPSATFVQAAATDASVRRRAPSTRLSATTSSSTSASPSASRLRAETDLSAPGGRIALSNWDAAGALALLRRRAGTPSRAPRCRRHTRRQPVPRSSSSRTTTVFRALLEDAGFEAVAVDAIAVEIPVASANELITSLADGTVRVGAALRARRRHAARPDAGVAGGASGANGVAGSGFAVPAPMKLASGTKRRDRDPDRRKGSSTGRRRRSASRASPGRRKRWRS